MPLLKKKTLEKAQVDEFLRDDEEVFHCAMTNEIFRDYDEFAERTILCNSMVWTCSMTGKSNLTYEEALQSEQNAKKMLNEFPTELHIPMLYIATLMKSSFSDMVEDVFIYIKDRFFIGEKVEACFSNKWANYKVITVIPPTEKAIQEAAKNAPGSTSLYTPANLYTYELVDVNADLKDVKTEKLSATSSQIRRKRGLYSREKSKLFLKQYVEPSGGGIVIKKAALDAFGINDMKFESIFAGPQPTFAQKSKAAAANGKKTRQETLAKFLSKNNIILPKSEEEKEHDVNKKKEKELAKEKERERKQQERELKKQRDFEIGLKLRDWHNPMNDLLLEDHKVLPTPISIKSKIPDKYLGDVFCVMEFAHTFSSVIGLRNYFPNGLTLSVMERILFETRVASPMANMIQMLLHCLFKLEAAEKEHYSNKHGGRWGASKETLAADRCHLWLLKNYGSQLFNIEIDILALSELLRLHLLSSGNNVNEAGVKWRSQYRGGFESDEDPAIAFRQHNPHILKALSLHHVCQLSMVDKLKLLECLVNQLLTYKETRDVIEQNLEDQKENRVKLKGAQVNERKRQADADTQIAQLKRGNVDLPADKAKERLLAAREAEEDLKSDYETVVTNLNSKVYQKTNFVGYDRAYRAYFKLHAVPGLAVNQEDHHQGSCLSEITQHVPELVGADKKGIVNYLQRMADEMNSSDKENEPKQNGVESKTTTTLAKVKELLMCSTDPTTCPVHGITKNPIWSVIDSEEQLDELIGSLNKRGILEKELLKVLEMDKANLVRLIGKTPRYVKDASEINSNRFHKDENWGFAETIDTNEVMRLTVLDRILTLEEDLFDGYLGGISKNREEFRSIVEENNYDKIDELTQSRLKWHIEADEDEKPVAPVDWEDPGKYLDKNRPDIDSEDSDIESDEILLAQTAADQKCIKFLAYALAQIALTVKLNFISKPLGQFAPNPKMRLGRQNVIVLWEQSLLNSTSYSQILLHYHVLNSAIAWKKSTLKMKCKTCKRGTNEQNILLCDYCNDGYHMYCLKPKLNVVPEGNWYCISCKDIVQKLEDAKQAKEEVMEVVSDEEEEAQNCHVCGQEETDDSIHCVSCLNMYHLECTSLKRAVRGAWTCNECKEASERDDKHANGDHFQRRSGRSNETNVDMPLNNAALQELLRDVIAHADGWPFIKPVHKHEVPDYYDIIKKPMDFGTIKYKLNMGDYQYDDEVLSDCQLVFENCHTYNSSGDEVYQCGSRLFKYFVKKCKDLKLEFETTVSMEMNGDSDEKDYEPQRKSRRMR